MKTPLLLLLLLSMPLNAHAAKKLEALALDKPIAMSWQTSGSRQEDLSYRWQAVLSQLGCQDVQIAFREASALTWIGVQANCPQPFDLDAETQIDPEQAGNPMIDTYPVRVEVGGDDGGYRLEVPVSCKETELVHLDTYSHDRARPDLSHCPSKKRRKGCVHQK